MCSNSTILFVNSFLYLLIIFYFLQNARSVCLKNIDVDMISSLGSLRSTTVILHVNSTNMTNICQILQCDVIHKQHLEGSEVRNIPKILRNSNMIMNFRSGQL